MLGDVLTAGGGSSEIPQLQMICSQPEVFEVSPICAWLEKQSTMRIVLSWGQYNLKKIKWEIKKKATLKLRLHKWKQWTRTCKENSKRDESL